MNATLDMIDKGELHGAALDARHAAAMLCGAIEDNSEDSAQEAIRHLEDALDRARAALWEAVRLIRDVEWSDGTADNPLCAWCKADTPPTHNETCALAAFLRRLA